ncbi:zinc finger and SCAN domain-containing protein 2-like [Pygocentrus nattereri]|uniref:zinc finger and SCAN domain-containing protein 2-like n=1 Tax=Pygocentrus nattereri TaxID=42514 RepID=UPI0008142AF7|nr:zinc finger and SCAN domain-containing protein 2-like [Pygocentrus nattereri]
MEEESSLTLHCYSDPDPEDTPDQQSIRDVEQDGAGAQPEGEPEPENTDEEEEGVSSVNPECEAEESSVFILDSVGQSEQQDSVQDVEQDGGSLSLQCNTDPDPTESVESSCTAAAQTPLKTCSVRLEDCRGTLTAEDGDLTPPGSGDRVPSEEHTEEPLHSCSDCGETFTSRDFLSHHRRTHTAASDQGTFRRESTHCTVLKSEDPPVPQRCSRCCVKFHCPFCPPAVYKPRHDAYSVNKHLQCHLKHAVRQRGYIICMCHLGCRPRGHFHCPICGSTVIRKDDAQSHISSCRVSDAPSEERLHPCADCGETFKTKHHLSYHLRTHTREKPQASGQETHPGENRHCTILKSEDPPVPQRCSRCCVKFHCPFCPPAVYKPRHDAYSVNKHLQCHLKHAVRQRGYIICMCHLGCRPRGHFHCPICGSTVIRKNDAQSHIGSCRGNGVKPPAERRAGETPHLCPHCGKILKSKRNLVHHQRIHTGEKPYLCASCGKQFSSLCSFSVHQVTHSGERPHHCSACGKRFKRKSECLIHQRRHSGEKPYLCATCGKQLSSRKTLSAHQKTHSGERPHRCLTCGKSFTLKSSLTAHRGTHTRPYDCPQCGKSFARSDNLRAHQRTHTKD